MLPKLFPPRLPLIAALSLLLASCGGTPTTLGSADSSGKTGSFSLVWRQQTSSVTDFSRIARNSDNNYCIVSANGNVSFISAEGEYLSDAYFRLPSDETYTAASCGEGLVAAVNRAGDLHVYAQDGEALWNTELNTRVLGAPVVAQGRLLVLSVTGQLAVFAAKTGEALWQYSSPLKSNLNTPVDSAPMVVGEQVYIGASNGGISALEFSTGQSLWDTSVSDSQGTNPVANIANVTTPLARGNTACAAGYQSDIGCFTADDGKILWNASISATRRAESDSSGRRVFVADNHNVLRAYSIASGKLLWETETPALATSAPLFANDFVFSGGEDGVLRAFSAEDGTFLGGISLGDAIYNLQAADDTAVSAQAIVALTANGSLAHLRFSYE